MGAAVVNILPFCNSVVTVQPSCQGVLDGQSKQRQTPPEPPNPSDTSRDRSRTLRVNSPTSLTSSRPKGRGFLRSSAGFAKSLRRVPASLRGLTAATLHRRHIGAYPALVRSLDEEDFKMTDSEKQDGGPYIPGLKRRGFTAPLR